MKTVTSNQTLNVTPFPDLDRTARLNLGGPSGAVIRIAAFTFCALVWVAVAVYFFG